MASGLEFTPGKIFVGGIAPTTTRETLKKYFGRYGEIIDSVLMQDKTTGKSRGFGFVTFRNPGLVHKVLTHTHYIGGKKVECKQALPMDQKVESLQEEHIDDITKIFVGGIPQTTTEASFRKYFEQYGKIEESFIMFDRATSKSRGFGFVIYSLASSADKVIENFDDNYLDGKWVECKKAFPRDEKNYTHSNYSTSPKQKPSASAKKTDQKLSSSNGDTYRSDSSEKSDVSSEKKGPLGMFDRAKNLHKEAEVDFLSCNDNITTDCKDYVDTKANTLLTLQPCYKEGSIWEDNIHFEGNSIEKLNENRKFDCEQLVFGVSGSDDEDENQEKGSEDTDQQLVNAHFILDQIDDSNSKEDSISKSLSPVTKEPSSNGDYYPQQKPRRTSLLFGVDLIDMQDSQAVLQGIQRKNFPRAQENGSTHIFFPALNKYHGMQAESDYLSQDDALGYDQTRFFKSAHCVWARDAYYSRLAQTRQEFS